MAKEPPRPVALPGIGSPLKPMGIAPGKEEYVRALQARLDAAIAHQRAGETEKAAAIYKSVLDQNPRQPDALNLLSTIEMAAGNHSVGLDLVTRAAMLRPKDPVILNNLGHSLIMVNRHGEAVAALARAVALKPDFIEALGNLGRAYRSAGRGEDAKLCYRTLIEQFPKSPSGHIGLARILQDEGEIAEAEKLIRQALAISPKNGAAHFALAHARKFRERNADVEAMLALAEDEANHADKKSIYYALGKIFDDINDFDSAFAYYDKANKAASETFDIKAFAERVDGLLRVFDKKFFASRKDFGCPSDRPIFILGMPRSGTTLLEQIISSHPQVYGAGELDNVTRLTRLSEDYTESPGGLGGTYPANLLTLTRMGSDLLAREYLRDLRAHSSEARFVTDKMPHNFLNVGFIALLFPNAKILHSRRSPPDNCLSIYMQNFNETHAYKHDLKRLGDYYRHYARLMEHWQRVLPDRIFDVQYEDLVANQEPRSREIIAHLGLEWSDECLNFHRAGRTVFTASRWQVRQPIYKGSVERWRNYANHLNPLLDQLQLKQ